MFSNLNGLNETMRRRNKFQEKVVLKADFFLKKIRYALPVGREEGGMDAPPGSPNGYPKVRLLTPMSL